IRVTGETENDEVVLLVSAALVPFADVMDLQPGRAELAADAAAPRALHHHLGHEVGGDFLAHALGTSGGTATEMVLLFSRHLACRRRRDLKRVCRRGFFGEPDAGLEITSLSDVEVVAGHHVRLAASGLESAPQEVPRLVTVVEADVVYAADITKQLHVV